MEEMIEIRTATPLVFFPFALAAGTGVGAALGFSVSVSALLSLESPEVLSATFAGAYTSSKKALMSQTFTSS
jgi:hypothetical protein